MSICRETFVNIGHYHIAVTAVDKYNIIVYRNFIN